MTDENGQASPARGLFGWIKALIFGSPDGGGGQSDKDLLTTSGFLIAVGAGGLLAMLIWFGSRQGGFLASLGLGSLIVASSGLVGGIVGLLFGIPKSISDPARAPVDADAGKGADSARPKLATNTNLEEISDWLTKIIVGVGLTQIGEIATKFETLTGQLAASFDANCADCKAAAPSSAVAAGCMVLFGLTLGFLSGYLLTRIFLTGAFNRVDLSLRVQQLQKQVKDVTQSNAEIASEKNALHEKLSMQQNAVRDGSAAQGRIYALLYSYEQRGFDEAIVELEQLLSQDIHKDSPALWTYLACAYGQAYTWGRDKDHLDASDPKMKGYRDKALEAARNALKSGDSWKPALQQAWDKYYPSKLGGGANDENDLEPFYDDKDFETLLGPKSPKPEEGEAPTKPTGP